MLDEDLTLEEAHISSLVDRYVCKWFSQVDFDSNLSLQKLTNWFC
jgi:hypothetical protein